MFVNGDKASAATKKLIELAISNKLHTVTILHRKDGDRNIYQWGGNTGIWFSPPLPTMELAFRYPVEHGLKPWEEPTE